MKSNDTHSVTSFSRIAEVEQTDSNTINKKDPAPARCPLLDDIKVRSMLSVLSDDHRYEKEEALKLNSQQDAYVE